jgi:RNA polymerase sporulation-specific sigma factor
MDEFLMNQSDEQLCSLAKTSQAALESLIDRCSYLVRACARPYFLTGGDSEDLIQEGMIGLLSAITAYDPSHNVPFRSFAQTCIHSRIVSAVRAAQAGKNRPLNDAVSLIDNALPQPGPEEQFLRREETQVFLTSLTQSLSPLERQILPLYLDGLSYREIAACIGKPEKSVDNAVQRIRRKAGHPPNLA